MCCLPEHRLCGFGKRKIGSRVKRSVVGESL